MFVCHKHRFVYVPFTKSGSSTMYKVLSQNFVGTKFRRTKRRIRPEDKQYTSFCVVRNPYSRLISWWWSICKPKGDRYGHKRELAKRGLPETLSGFLTLWEEKKGTDQYSHVKANDGIDYVLKLGNLEQDFNSLPFVTKHISIPCVNKKNHPPWQELLDPESGRLINRIYKQDFEFFNYAMLEF